MFGRCVGVATETSGFSVDRFRKLRNLFGRRHAYETIGSPFLHLDQRKPVNKNGRHETFALRPPNTFSSFALSPLNNFFKFCFCPAKHTFGPCFAAGPLPGPKRTDPPAHTYRSDLSSIALSARLTGIRRRSCCGSAEDGCAHMPISTAAPAMVPVTLSWLPGECGWTRTFIRWRPPADRRALGRANKGTKKYITAPTAVVLLLLTSRYFQLLLLFKSSVSVVRFYVQNLFVPIPPHVCRLLRGRHPRLGVPGRFPGRLAVREDCKRPGPRGICSFQFSSKLPRARNGIYFVQERVDESTPESRSPHSLVRFTPYVLFKTYGFTQIPVSVYDEF